MLTNISETSFIITESEWTSLKSMLDKRYTEITALLRYNKTREESIQKLSNEIQKYREGFAFSVLKPLIMELISFREECRKSVRDSEQYPLDEDKAKKYLNYLVSDFDELMSNIGLERKDDVIYINGKLISEKDSNANKCEETKTTESAVVESANDIMNTINVNDLASLVEYINKIDEIIHNSIKDKSVLDLVIKNYIDIASRTDVENYKSLVAPVARKLFSFYDILTKKAVINDNQSDDETIKQYITLLIEIQEKLEAILVCSGVMVESTNYEFDTKKHKLLKTIITDDENLNRTIANVYTDCYQYDEKVIYQSKVDVYKYQEKNNSGE